MLYVLVPSSRRGLRNIGQWLDTLLQPSYSYTGAADVFCGAPMETGSSVMKPQSLQLVLEEQVLALQQQMAENQAASWRKLKNSQEAQKRQATLVRKLQAKVRQMALWGRGKKPPLEWALGWDRAGGGRARVEPHFLVRMARTLPSIASP